MDRRGCTLKRLALRPALHLSCTPSARWVCSPASFLRRSPQATVTLPEGLTGQLMDERVALRADRHEVHEAFSAEVLVGAVMQMHARHAWSLADETVAGQLRRPVPLTRGTPLSRLDVLLVLVGAVLGAAGGRHGPDRGTGHRREVDHDPLSRTARKRSVDVRSDPQ